MFSEADSGTEIIGDGQKNSEIKDATAEGQTQLKGEIHSHGWMTLVRTEGEKRKCVPKAGREGENADEAQSAALKQLASWSVRKPSINPRTKRKNSSTMYTK